MIVAFLIEKKFGRVDYLFILEEINAYRHFVHSAKILSTIFGHLSTFYGLCLKFILIRFLSSQIKSGKIKSSSANDLLLMIEKEKK